MTVKIIPGVDDAPADPVDVDVTVEPEITNAVAKKLPWVQAALNAQAELVRLKAAQEEARVVAERQKAESEGNYQAALKIEQDKVKKIEADAAAKLRKMELESEWVKAGAADPRAVKIFEDQYDPEKGTIAEFVATLKADESNALYFTTPTKTKPKPPAPTGGGDAPEFTPALLEEYSRSPDSALRAKAAKYKGDYLVKHGKLPPKG